MRRRLRRAARVSVPVVQGIHLPPRGTTSPATQKLPGVFCTRSLPLAAAGGFSLLEVVLALAILTATVAILGELIRSGLHNAQLARDLSKAELIAESVLYRIESGLLPHQAANRTPVDLEPGWYYSVENASSGTQAQGLLQLRVTVELTPDKQKRPTKFSVVRWLRDPSLVLAQQAQQLSVLPTSGTSSTGTSSSPSSSTMGSGVF